MKVAKSPSNRIIGDALKILFMDYSVKFNMHLFVTHQ